MNESVLSHHGFLAIYDRTIYDLRCTIYVPFLLSHQAYEEAV